MKKILLSLILVLMAAVSAQAACTQAIPTQAKGLWLSGGMTSTHAYKLAFYQSTATSDATSTSYSSSNEITGTNYSAGGYALAGYAVSATTPTAFVDFTDNVQSNVTFNQASTCAIIYDSTLTNAACTGSNTPFYGCTGSGTGTIANAIIYVGTFTSVQPSAGTLTTTFPTPDSTNAILRIGMNAWSNIGDYLFPDAEASERRDAWVVLRGLEIFGASK